MTDAQGPDAGAGSAPGGGDGASAGERQDALMAALLPRLSQLSGVLSRGRFVERAMEAAGITLERPAVTVLITLHMADEPLRIGAIATRMQVVGPHVTRLVNGLEQRKMIRRVTDPLDQRARLIEATPAGRAVAEGYVRVLLGWFTEVLADWPDQDRQDLGRLLGRFADDLSTHLAGIGEEPSAP